MWGLLNNPLAKKILGSMVRKALAALSGFLVAEGYLEQADVSAFIAAVLPIAVSAIWSILQKRQSEKEVKVALELPSGTPRETLDAAVKG